LPDLGWIDLDVFADDGLPVHRRGVVTGERGLVFVGPAVSDLLLAGGPHRVSEEGVVYARTKYATSGCPLHAFTGLTSQPALRCACRDRGLCWL
jgi:hypothetical protein